MSAQVGDKVIYHPGTTGRPTAEATVTAVNPDGSVNITYPHHADESVLATAESCQWGTGLYQVSSEDDHTAAQLVSMPPSPEVEALQAELAGATSALAAADQQIAALQAVVSDKAKEPTVDVAALQADNERLTAELAASQSELAALTATKQPEPEAEPSMDMTKDTLVAYAEAHQVNIEGADTKAAILERIEAAKS